MPGLPFTRALVTGGAGFIGSHIVDALAASGCQVTVVDNLSTGRLANLSHLMGRVTFIEGDIRDRNRMLAAAGGVEVIFHQAAVVSVPATVETPVESAQVNQMGTLQVLDAARRRGVGRVVLASSCAVYGDDPELPKHEGLAAVPASPYAAQKRANEVDAGLFYRLYGLETVCLRYFNVYGPRQDPSSAYSGVISIFMTRAASETPPVIYGDGSQCRDFVFVGDVVRANLLAAGAPPAVAGGVYNIGTGETVRIDRLWKLISALSGFNAPPRVEPKRTGDIHASRAAIARAAALLGFTPRVTFEQGLKTTFDWYTQSRY
jgi:UDP-glucose 4-epimerase